MISGNIFCAIRGPILLITIGVLFVLDHNGVFSFDRTWPLLIVVFGLLKLAERLGGGAMTEPPYPQYPPPPPPPPSYTGPVSGGGTQS